MTVFTISSELLILLLSNLVWWHTIISQCLMKRLDCCVQGQVVNECLPRWYHLNCWTFYNQTWYGSASSWARVYFKKLDLLSSRPRSEKLRRQKLKSHLVGTQSLNILPLKPGVGQYIALHAPLTARDFFLISTLPVHSLAFFSPKLPDFSCVVCG